MVLEVDQKALEWRVAAQLSQDPVMCQEVRNGEDQHEKIRQSVFHGKVERVIAKIFNFRMIYADENSAGYSYYMDPTMPAFSRRKWDEIVSSFFQHYSGFSSWHSQIVKTAYKTGRLTGPTGRYWLFHKRQGRAGLEYNKAQIYNYPVQGTSADVVKLYMCDMMSALKPYPDVKLVNCVHDSLIFDLPKNCVDMVSELCYNIGHNQHTRLKEVYGVDWNVPLGVEVKTGHSWGEMTTVKETANG